MRPLPLPPILLSNFSWPYRYMYGCLIPETHLGCLLALCGPFWPILVPILAPFGQFWPIRRRFWDPWGHPWRHERRPSGYPVLGSNRTGGFGAHFSIIWGLWGGSLAHFWTLWCPFESILFKFLSFLVPGWLQKQVHNCALAF